MIVKWGAADAREGLPKADAAPTFRSKATHLWHLRRPPKGCCNQAEVKRDRPIPRIRGSRPGYWHQPDVLKRRGSKHGSLNWQSSLLPRLRWCKDGGFFNNLQTFFLFFFSDHLKRRFRPQEPFHFFDIHGGVNVPVKPLVRFAAVILHIAAAAKIAGGKPELVHVQVD